MSGCGKGGESHREVGQRRSPLPDVADVACLELQAGVVDLGTLPAGCSRRQDFWVANVCAAPVLLRKVELTGANGVAMVQSPAVPGGGLQLAAGAALHLAVRHLPSEAGLQSAALELTLAGAAGDTSVQWTFFGRSTPADLFTDTFTLPPRAQRDVLVVIDNGPLLGPHLESVRTNLANFARYLVGSRSTRRIAFATTGGSAGAGGTSILDPSAPGFEAAVQQLLAALEIRPGNEDPLQVAVDVLKEAHPQGASAGLLQTPPTTGIILVTAGPDRSPQPARDYLLGLQHLAAGAHKGRRIHFTIDAIARYLGENSPSCGGEPDDGTLHFLVQQTNGVKDDICTPDWSKTLEELGTLHLGFRTSFALTHPPALALGKVEVSIDGTPLPATDDRGATVWTYDSVQNSVNFEPMYSPEPDQLLRVRYPRHCPQ